jgi:hypothetical protein
MSRVSRRSDARAAAVRQLSYGYFHDTERGTASVRCPDPVNPPHSVSVVLNYGVRTPAQITAQLRDALTDHILEHAPEATR